MVSAQGASYVLPTLLLAGAIPVVFGVAHLVRR
jgi:hypothetical protein